MAGHESNYGRIPPPKINDAALKEDATTSLRRAMFVAYAQALCLHFNKTTFQDRALDSVQRESMQA